MNNRHNIRLIPNIRNNRSNIRLKSNIRNDRSNSVISFLNLLSMSVNSNIFTELNFFFSFTRYSNFSQRGQNNPKNIYVLKSDF